MSVDGRGVAVDLALGNPDLVSALVVSGAGTSEIEFADPWVLGVLAALQRTEAARYREAGWMLSCGSLPARTPPLRTSPRRRVSGAGDDRSDGSEPRAHRQIGDDYLGDPSGQGPGFDCQRMEVPRPQRNRMHIDIAVPHEQAEARIADALAAGAS